jgi:hypothetical protein
MSVRQVLEAAARAGISVTIDGPDLVVEATGDIPEPLIVELRRQKPEILAALKASKKSSARVSDLWETETDYARALIRYARQDDLGLTIKNGRLVISIGSKSDADLLGELRKHEAAVIACLREGARKDKIPDFSQST